MRLMLIFALVCAPVLLGQTDPVVKPAPKAGQADIRDGEDAFEDGRMQDAIDCFTKAITAQPANDELYAYRAAAYVALEKIAEAETDLAEATKLETTFSLAFNTRGYIRWLKHELPGAIEDYTAAIAYAADDRRVDAGGRAQMYQNRGIAYQDAGNTDRALLDFNSCIQLAPSYPAFYENRGLIYVDKQLFDIAFKDFDTALELDPKSARGYVNRAWAARLMGDFEQSVRDYSQALRIKPDYGQALIGRGHAWLGWGREEQALADFKAAKVVDPKLEGAAVCGAADVYNLRNETGTALVFYSTAYTANNHYVPALFGLAKTSTIRESWDLAAKYGRLLCDEAPGVATHWGLLGNALAMKSEFETAIVALNRSVELDATNLGVRLLRARCYAKQNLFEVALAEVRVLLDVNPKLCLVALARVFAVRNATNADRVDALKYLSDAAQAGADFSGLADDADFAVLKADPEFKKLVEKK